MSLPEPLAVMITHAIDSHGGPRGAILEALRLVQHAENWVSDERIADIAALTGMTTAEIDNLASFYSHIFRKPVGRHLILLCDGASCWMNGGEAVAAAVKARLGIGFGETTPDGEYTLHQHLLHRRLRPCPRRHDRPQPQARRPAHPRRHRGAAHMSTAPLTGRARPDRRPHSLAEWQADGGYAALARARQQPPAAIIDMVAAAALNGRGGAGFPAAQKWRFMPAPGASPGDGPSYLIVNGDEMEPGAFKDRLFLEALPHLVLEGAMIAAHAMHVGEIIILVRDAYRTGIHAMEHAIGEVEAAGLAGRLKLRVHASAGRYIVGEETALIEALEGKRAVPRKRPPFPAQSGLWGRPTTVNNVETIANIPGIVANGADWFRSLSRTAEGGTKLFGVSGRVHQPRLIEAPMGTTARELIAACGGVSGTGELLAFQPGGGASGFLGPEHLDTPLDFANVASRRLDVRHRHADRPRHRHLPDRRHRPPHALLRARKLRLVHPLPRRPALGGAHHGQPRSRHGETRRPRRPPHDRRRSRAKGPQLLRPDGRRHGAAGDRAHALRTPVRRPRRARVPGMTVRLTIDGRAVEAREGEDLLTAATHAGIEVPHFCWHRAMGSIGACRLCAVTVRKSD